MMPPTADDNVSMSTDRGPFPRYLGAASQSALRQRIAEIADAGLKSPSRLTLLIGAGFSKDARDFPTGEELAGRLVEQKYKDCPPEVARDIASVPVQREMERERIPLV